MRKVYLVIVLVCCTISMNAQTLSSQTIPTQWGNYIKTNIPGYGNTLLQVRVNGQNSVWNGLFSINGENSWTPDMTWNNCKLISFSGYNAGTDDVQALIMSNTPGAFGGTTIVLKTAMPASGSASISVVATGQNAGLLSMSDNSSSLPYSGTMASSAGTYNLWVVNNNVGIGTFAPRTLLDLGELRFDKITSFPAEGSISELDWGNYIIGDANNSQRLRLGVANDLNTRAEIFLDNSNRSDGTISFKTGNGGAAQTRMFINGDGYVGIGTIDTKGYRLAVNGDAIFTKVKVKQYGTWPDYVFAHTYKLISLKEVEAFIKQHKHLPEVPSAEEVRENGLDMGETQVTVLKKIEELTLYVIEQNKKIEELQIELQAIKKGQNK